MKTLLSNVPPEQAVALSNAIHHNDRNPELQAFLKERFEVEFPEGMPRHKFLTTYYVPGSGISLSELVSEWAKKIKVYALTPD